MDNDGAQERMEEGSGGVVVEETAQFFHKGRQFLVVRGLMHHFIGHHVLDYHLIVGAHAAGIFGLVERVFGHQGMQMHQQFGGEFLVFVFDQELYRPIVVEDHQPALVFRRFSLAEHAHGITSSGRSSFELRRSNGFFENRTHQIVGACRLVGQEMAAPLSAELQICFVTHALHLRGEGEVNAKARPCHDHLALSGGFQVSPKLFGRKAYAFCAVFCIRPIGIVVLQSVDKFFDLVGCGLK